MFSLYSTILIVSLILLTTAVQAKGQNNPCDVMLEGINTSMSRQIALNTVSAKGWQQWQDPRSFKLGQHFTFSNKAAGIRNMPGQIIVRHIDVDDRVEIEVQYTADTKQAYLQFADLINKRINQFCSGGNTSSNANELACVNTENPGAYLNTGKTVTSAHSSNRNDTRIVVNYGEAWTAGSCAYRMQVTASGLSERVRLQKKDNEQQHRKSQLPTKPGRGQ